MEGDGGIGTLLFVFAPKRGTGGFGGGDIREDSASFSFDRRDDIRSGFESVVST